MQSGAAYRRFVIVGVGLFAIVPGIARENAISATWGTCRGIPSHRRSAAARAQIIAAAHCLGMRSKKQIPRNEGFVLFNNCCRY
jgi:hypothetical protein